MLLWKIATAALVLVATATPLYAQNTAPPPPVSVSGGVTVTTDYRFRGIAQTNEGPALQGTLNLDHQSGFYIGAWASTIDDKVSRPGYGGVEVDLYGGYSKTFDNGVGADAGLLYYWYTDAPSGTNVDFFEPYASLSYALGPVSAKLGANYTWSARKGIDLAAGKDDSLYLYGEASAAIPTTPFTLKGHVGRINGALGHYNPAFADDDYWDWSAGIGWAGGPISGSVSYVDTDISNANGFAQDRGRGATVIGTLGLSF